MASHSQKVGLVWGHDKTNTWELRHLLPKWYIRILIDYTSQICLTSELSLPSHHEASQKPFFQKGSQMSDVPFYFRFLR